MVMMFGSRVRGVLLGTVIGLGLAGLVVVWNREDFYMKHQSVTSFNAGQVFRHGDGNTITLTALKTSIDDYKDERKEKATQPAKKATILVDTDQPVSKHSLYKSYGHVHTIVFFIGYPRSRHSLLGSLLDAHPHMVVSDERMAFSKWRGNPYKFINSSIYEFYDVMFEASQRSVARGRRANVFEGSVVNKTSVYGYYVPNQWQGSFDKYIEVIGDKAGAFTASSMLRDNAIDAVHLLEQTAAAKVKFVHVVRNPFDNIATMVLQHKDVKGRNGEHEVKIDAPKILDDKIVSYFKWAEGSNKAREALPGSVIDIPSIEIVLNPAETLRKICKFLEITYTEKYLQDCAATVDSTPSITRNYIQWTAEQKNRVYKQMKRFSFLRGYSFNKSV